MIKCFLLSEISSLTRIKDQLPPYVEYNHIKVVIALLLQRHGQEVGSNGEMIVARGTSHSEAVRATEITDGENADSNTTVVSSVHNCEEF